VYQAGGGLWQSSRGRAEAPATKLADSATDRAAPAKIEQIRRMNIPLLGVNHNFRRKNRLRQGLGFLAEYRLFR
jgi:hypothetical protein